MPWVPTPRSWSAGIAFRLSLAALRVSITRFLSRFVCLFRRNDSAGRGKPMRYTDIALVGGGLAGSTAAAMLGRAGIPAILIDPHTMYPPDLRCEKISGDQVNILRKTGLAEATLRAATLDGHVWLARFGYLLDKKPSDQYGIMYDTLVNTMRTQIPGDVETIHAKAIAISASAERQKIVLSNGDEISARLVVL